LYKPAEADKLGYYSDLPYLVQAYAVSYHYSATLWLDDFNRHEALAGSPLRMLAMAADYSIRDSLSRERTDNLRQLRRALPPLPATYSEVDFLSQVFEGDFLKGKTATESKFKEIAANFSILHLAMHGLADFNDYRLAKIAFTEDGNPKEDNFLDGGEIEHLHLRAMHIVLSACETAAGESSEGEGALSLARAFSAAGNPSLLVSLWQVNDQITSQFMQIYYQHLLKGLPKAQALQQTQLDYLQFSQGLAAHPAYWSPFVQVGHNAPITTAKSTSIRWAWWLLGGGAVALLVLGATVARRASRNG
jgi:CHAT domain-containing protein